MLTQATASTTTVYDTGAATRTAAAPTVAVTLSSSSSSSSTAVIAPVGLRSTALAASFMMPSALTSAARTQCYDLLFNVQNLLPIDNSYA
eukprot:908-Heterococcus_DN1.PRE.3